MFGMFGKRKTPSQNSQLIPSLPSTGSAKVSATVPTRPASMRRTARIAALLASTRRVVAAFANGKKFA